MPRFTPEYWWASAWAVQASRQLFLGANQDCASRSDTQRGGSWPAEQGPSCLADAQQKQHSSRADANAQVGAKHSRMQACNAAAFAHKCLWVTPACSLVLQRQLKSLPSPSTHQKGGLAAIENTARGAWCKSSSGSGRCVQEGLCLRDQDWPLVLAVQVSKIHYQCSLCAGFLSWAAAYATEDGTAKPRRRYKQRRAGWFQVSPLHTHELIHLCYTPCIVNGAACWHVTRSLQPARPRGSGNLH
jgi:hypothetical protein